DPAIVAHHFAEADRVGETWEWSIRAAERARGAAAWVEAEEHYAQALRAADRKGSATPVAAVATLAEDYGEVCERLGRQAVAPRASRRARDATTPGLDRSRILRKWARADERANRFRAAYRRYGEAFRAVPGDGRDDEAARAAAELGQAYIRWHQGRYDD